MTSSVLEAGARVMPHHQVSGWGSTPTVSTAVGRGEGPWGAQASTRGPENSGDDTLGSPALAASWVLKAPGPEPLPSVSGHEPVTLVVPWAPADAG